MFERLFFTASLAAFAVFYGFVSAQIGWFPAPFLERALEQGEAILGRPHFVAPRIYHDSGVNAPHPEEVQPGLTMIATNWRHLDWRPGLRLIGPDGQVQHEWAVDVDELFPRPVHLRNPATAPFIHGTHLFADGRVLLNVEYVGSALLNSCAEVVWTLEEGSHHSVAVSDHGTFWIPATHSAAAPPFSPRYPDGYPGLHISIPHDRILEVGANGEIQSELSVLDILYENGLQRFLAKGKESVGNDRTHLNSIAPLSAGIADEYPLFEPGDLLLSIRNADLVMVVDPSSLEVRWYTSEPFIQQHDPQFVGDGWIGVFDNNSDWTLRGELTGGSRIVKLQPHTDSLRIAFPTPQSDAFHTDIMGKWQPLENGNLLLTESRAGRVVEVNPQGRTVWEWIAEPFNESLVAEVSEGTRYALSSDQVDSWACSPT